MNIVLAGGTGFIGTRFIEWLRGRGHEIRVLSRKPRAPETGLRYFEWDAATGHPPSESLDGADAVVNLAGEPVLQRWNNDAKRRIRESRVGGTRRLVEALSTASPRPSVLVSASAIGYYGNRGDESLTETSDPGKGFLPRISVEWEKAAELAESLGIRVVRLRIGIVLGTNGGALKQMLPPFRMGAGGRLGSGKQWMSWIHIDDLIRMIVFAISNANATGPFNGTAPWPVRNAEFTRTLASTLHRPAIFPVPGFALRLMLGEAGSALLESQRVLPRAALSAGFPFAFPKLEVALQDLLTPGK